MKLDKNQIWHDVLESIKVSVSSPIFTTWISKTQLQSLKKVGDTRYLADVSCSSVFVKTQIQDRYFGLIQDALIKTIGSPCDVTFSINSSLPAPKTSISAPLFEEDDKNEELTNRLISSNIRLGFTFENFAVSGSNQMAFAAAESVSNSPGTSYNPLYIWGGVGVGKTHLMQAVGFRLLKRDLNAKVLLCSGEEFTNDIIQGIRNKSTQSFRDKYRKLKGLFVDDIQFIAGKDAVQEEFFHTFNAVTGAGGQIILTSDKPPSEINNFEARLRSRFEAGLTVDISEPDFELKCAIVQIKAKEKGIELTIEEVKLVAGNIEGARQIQGFLTRLSSESKLKNTLISEDLIKSLLGKGQGINQVDIKKVKATPDGVMLAVSNHFGVTKKALISHVRARTIARPRQILMYLLRTELGLPLQEVGHIIGGRDHSTVLHAVDTISQLASRDEKIRGDLLGIKNAL